MQDKTGSEASNPNDGLTPNGFVPTKATEDQLRQALQALYDQHTCDQACRTCDYAWNLLNDEPDNGEGIGQASQVAVSQGRSGEKPECHIDGCDQFDVDGAYIDLTEAEPVLSSGIVLHTTAPHGEHTVILVEDHEEPGQRLYDIVGGNKPGVVGATGEEFANLAAFWAAEKTRAVTKQLGFETKFLRIKNVRLNSSKGREDLVKVEAYEDATGTGIHIAATCYHFMEKWELVDLAVKLLREHHPKADITFASGTMVDVRHIEVDMDRGEVTYNEGESGPLDLVNEFGLNK